MSAAAAVLLSLRPTLRPEQVTKILQSTAIDLDASTGCAACADGPRRVLGLGAARRRRGDRRAVEAAPGTRLLRGERRSRRAGVSRPTEPNRRIQATVDFWDDQDDVYAIRLEAEPAGLRRAHGVGHERRSEPRVLASAGALGRARRGLPLPRPHVCPHRLAPVPLVPPAARRGRTTSRCACRARARRATGSTIIKG